MEKSKTAYIICILFTLYFCFSLVFVGTNVVEDTQKNTLPMVVPYIEMSAPLDIYFQATIALVIFLVGLVYCKAKIKYDIFTFFLLYRMITMVFQIASITMFANGTVRSGNYFFYAVELLLYIGLLNNKSMLFLWNSFSKIIKYFCIAISIEVIFQALFGVLPKVAYTDIWYKSCMRIPVGGTNSLATIIVPVLAMILLSKKKRSKLDNTCLAIGFVAVFFTKSRIGMMLAVLSCFGYIIKIFRSREKRKVLLTLVICALLLMGGGFIISRYLNEIITVALGFSSIMNESSWINGISSGRTGDFIWYFEQIIKHPIFGSGPNYEHSRAHMLVIDVLYQNGLVGFLFLFTAIKTSLKKCKNIFIMRDIRNIVIVLVINSLFEISFFTSFILDIYLFVALAVINGLDYSIDEVYYSDFYN